MNNAFHNPRETRRTWKTGVSFHVFTPSFHGRFKTVSINVKRLPTESEQGPVVGEASTWFDLGCALQNGGRYQEALSAFEQAQAIDPNFPALQNKIASAYFPLKNYARA